MDVDSSLRNTDTEQNPFKAFIDNECNYQPNHFNI